MFLATKAAWAGIVFIFLTTGISRSRPTVLASGANLSKEVPVVQRRNDVKKMQQILRGKGYYRGKAGKLGVKREDPGGTGNESMKGKPSAGMKWAAGSGRASKTRRKAVKTVAAPDSGRTLPAESDNHSQ
jgi:hypothetical protein